MKNESLEQARERARRAWRALGRTDVRKYEPGQSLLLLRVRPLSADCMLAYWHGVRETAEADGCVAVIEIAKDEIRRLTA